MFIPINVIHSYISFCISCRTAPSGVCICSGSFAANSPTWRSLTPLLVVLLTVRSALTAPLLVIERCTIKSELLDCFLTSPAGFVKGGGEVFVCHQHKRPVVQQQLQAAVAAGGAAVVQRSDAVDGGGVHLVRHQSRVHPRPCDPTSQMKSGWGSGKVLTLAPALIRARTQATCPDRQAS